jgi:hypothetical protein
MNLKTVALSLAGLAMVGCGDDTAGSFGTVTVNLTYPSQGRAEANTSSVRIWVLSPLRDELRCSQLISTETEPFVPRDFERFADVVFNVSDSTPPFTIEEVRSQARVLVYGEVTDFVGTTILAGCAELEASLGEATLRLIKPETYDCSDPATVDGRPCDDGLYCTIGEECAGGSCGGGMARGCEFVADQCNGSTCSEELGCQPVASPQGTNCDDGSDCTLGDQCDGSGSCTPGPVDCTAEDRGVCVVGVCNEQFQTCEAIDSDTTISALDDQCSILANIVATDCYRLVPGDECNASSGRCNLTTMAVPPVSCTNQCVTDGTCSGTLCTGGTPVATPEEATEVTCNDSRDNDCDNLVDCADSDCAASADCAL